MPDLAQWSEWGFDRVAVLFTAVLYAVIWVQVSLYHRAGAFKHWAMWGPVILTPVIVGGAVAGALARDGVWGLVALALLAIGVLDGLIGIYYHFRGVLSQIGGLSMRNLLSGPPVLLPLSYAAFGLLGLAGMLWDA